ncbi:MAG: hypothetical protein ACM3SQ_04270 [Betaproteobacteria bacterium]
MRWSILALALALTVQVGRAQAPNAPAPGDAGRLAALLERSGLKYQKAGEGVWLLDFAAAEGKVIRVLVASSGGLAVFATTLKGASAAELTRDDLLAINKLNAEIDRVKVGVDDQRDLFLRVDLTLRTLDVEDLKTNASQVAAAAQKAAATLAPRFALR